MPLPPEYYNEMMKMKHPNTELKNYKGYPKIAAALEPLLGHTLTAGFIGAIIPECGTDHTVINKKEYDGRGTKGTESWNCGEGLVGFTFWENKLDLIKKYNADSRCTQPLPTSPSQYFRGTPFKSGGFWHAEPDGQHIAGLSLSNQMIILFYYYDKLLKTLKSETDFATIVAKIYQEKAGKGFFKEYRSTPIVQAYKTAEKKYGTNNDTVGNHYLMSLKIGLQYLGKPIDTSVSVDTVNLEGVSPMAPPAQEYIDGGTVDWSSVKNGFVKKSNKDGLSALGDGKIKIPGRIMGTHLIQR